MPWPSGCGRAWPATTGWAAWGTWPSGAGSWPGAPPGGAGWRRGVAGDDWLDSVGNVAERAGKLALVTQGGHMVAEDPSRRYAWLKTGQLYFQVDGDQVVVSATLQGLVVAG